jgi:hypothetical protein
VEVFQNRKKIVFKVVIIIIINYQGPLSSRGKKGTN